MKENQYDGEFQDGGEFTIASSKTPALQANGNEDGIPVRLKVVMALSY